MLKFLYKSFKLCVNSYVFKFLHAYANFLCKYVNIYSLYMYKRAYILQLGKFDIETHNSNQSKKERTGLKKGKIQLDQLVNSIFQIKTSVWRV